MTTQDDGTGESRPRLRLSRSPLALACFAGMPRRPAACPPPMPCPLANYKRRKHRVHESERLVPFVERAATRFACLDASPSPLKRVSDGRRGDWRPYPQLRLSGRARGPLASREGPRTGHRSEQAGLVARQPARRRPCTGQSPGNYSSSACPRGPRPEWRGWPYLNDCAWLAVGPGVGRARGHKCPVWFSAPESAWKL